MWLVPEYHRKYVRAGGLEPKLTICKWVKRPLRDVDSSGGSGWHTGNSFILPLISSSFEDGNRIRTDDNEHSRGNSVLVESSCRSCTKHNKSEY